MPCCGFIIFHKFFVEKILTPNSPPLPHAKVVINPLMPGGNGLLQYQQFCEVIPNCFLKNSIKLEKQQHVLVCNTQVYITPFNDISVCWQMVIISTQINVSQSTLCKYFILPNSSFIGHGSGYCNANLFTGYPFPLCV